MKKTFLMFITISIIITLVAAIGTAFADDTGVQIIDGSNETMEAISMNDMKTGDVVRLEDFGEITISSISFVDSIPTDIDPGSFSTWRGDARSKISSGPQAEYLRIRIHILNIQHSSFDFHDAFGEVSCCFDNNYQFGGWHRQERFQWNEFWTMFEDSDDSYALDPLYEGYYDVVVTLPNYVVESKDPLSVTFIINDNEFTCNVRK